MTQIKPKTYKNNKQFKLCPKCKENEIYINSKRCRKCFSNKKLGKLSKLK